MKKSIITIFCLLYSLSFSAQSDDSTPLLKRFFTSDQCTFWPDSSSSKDWSHCCVQHDFYYWAGGTQKERETIDQELKSCIQKSSGHINAELMFMGVRLGSLSPVKFGGKQWGNAWGNEVRQTQLRPKEIQKLKHALLSTLPQGMSYSDIDTFVDKLKQR